MSIGSQTEVKHENITTQVRISTPVEPDRCCVGINTGRKYSPVVHYTDLGLNPTKIGIRRVDSYPEHLVFFCPPAGNFSDQDRKTQLK